METYNTHPTLKLQRELSRCAHAVASREYNRACASVSDDVCKSDVIATHARSLSSSILRVQLSDIKNRMTQLEFVTWMRFFLRIPQLARLGNARHSIELGYQAEECFHHHQKGNKRLLDLHANHANSGCPSSAAGLSRRHTLFKWAIYYAAKEAGCEVTMEPKTENLLLKQFTADQCRALFPKKPSKTIKARIETLKNDLNQVETMEHGHEKNKLVRLINNECKILHKQHLTKGLRIDVQITDHQSGHEKWVDTTCIHPTCQSRIQAEWKDTQNPITSYELDRKEGKQNLTTKIVGHAVKTQTRFKHQIYSPLVTIAHKQKIDRKRNQTPIFIAAVASTL